VNITFVYGPFSVGARPIDVSLLYTSPRGLTGSEWSCFALAREMARRGHAVRLRLSGQQQPIPWNGVLVVPLLDTQDSPDVVYSWNEPEQLQTTRAGIRMVNQQLNDFDYCKPGFDSFVDVYTSPSKTHLDFIAPQTPSPEKWRVLPNGCDPSLYSGEKVPGRVIYASSPDRGLHLLLQVWPRIKAAVPHAHLRVFYEMGPWFESFLGREHFIFPDGSHEDGLTELGYRARYVEQALKRCAHLGIEAIGSVSRDRMKVEMSEAEVLAFPCDTIRFTEGFSVTTMEACAAGAIPVLFPCDALKEIYGGLPMARDLDDFAQLVIDSLTDPIRAEVSRADAADIAQLHTWDLLAERLEGIIRACASS
jgi:glycosyltransferase involved in cell wall biosynthesis